MKQSISSLVMMITFVILTITKCFAHCEVPCGIYNDSLRFELIREHVATIEKSMKSIQILIDQDDRDFNQLTRWINTKDEYASKVQNIITQYFMTQRLKPSYKGDKHYNEYLQQLGRLHLIQVYAMKCKQTTNTMYCDNIRSVLNEFEYTYFHR